MKQAILLVDDSPEDVRSIRLSFKRAGLLNRIFVVNSVDAAADFWSGTGAYRDRKKYPVPGVLLISLHLPECRALHLLHWLREQVEVKKVLRIALVKRTHLKEVVRAYEVGADSFLVKPVSEDDLRNLLQSFPQYWDRRKTKT